MTDTDIGRGNRRGPLTSPLSYAIARAAGTHACSVLQTTFCLGDGVWLHALPPEAADWQARYMAGAAVGPAAFEVVVEDVGV